MRLGVQCEHKRPAFVVKLHAVLARVSFSMRISGDYLHLPYKVDFTLYMSLVNNCLIFTQCSRHFAPLPVVMVAALARRTEAHGKLQELASGHNTVQNAARFALAD